MRVGLDQAPPAPVAQRKQAPGSDRLAQGLSRRSIAVAHRQDQATPGKLRALQRRGVGDPPAPCDHWIEMEDVRLRLGITADSALDSLRSLRLQAGNVAAGGGGIAPERHRDEYLAWVETAEVQLRSLFAAPDVWRKLYTDRYWHLRELTSDTPRPYPLVDMEARWQVTRLERLAERLRQAQQFLELPAGSVAVVPDTNVFAHYRRFDEIRWPELAGAKQVRLVVPLLVLDELDKLSYKSRSGGERAAGALRALAWLRGDSLPEAPVHVREGTTLQFLVDPPGHQRRANSDDELLTRVEDLVAVVGEEVRVATGDYGMHVRARARGLRCLTLPEELRLP